MQKRARLSFLLSLVSAVVLGSQALAADTVSSRPLRILVGFAPGGGTDTTARVLAPRLSELLKQTVVVESRPGAGGSIASELLTKSAPDGNTILLGTVGSLAVNQHINKLGYNPVTDMQALSLAIVFPNVLVVNAKTNINTLAEYVRMGKADQTKLTFGSSGVGSAGHLAGELFNKQAGLQAQHVAYRGGAPAMADLLGGVVTSIFSTPPDAIKYIEAGKLVALAVTGSQRMDVLPKVPTIAESGYAGYEALNWYAFAAPLKTPPEVVQRLNQAIVTALKDPEVAAKLLSFGMNPRPTTPQQAAQFIRAESDKWATVVRDAGIKAP